MSSESKHFETGQGELTATPLAPSKYLSNYHQDLYDLSTRITVFTRARHGDPPVQHKVTTSTMRPDIVSHKRQKTNTGLEMDVHYLKYWRQLSGVSFMLQT